MDRSGHTGMRQRTILFHLRFACPRTGNNRNLPTYAPMPWRFGKRRRCPERLHNQWTQDELRSFAVCWRDESAWKSARWKWDHPQAITALQRVPLPPQRLLPGRRLEHALMRFSEFVKTFDEAAEKPRRNDGGACSQQPRRQAHPRQAAPVRAGGRTSRMSRKKGHICRST